MNVSASASTSVKWRLNEMEKEKLSLDNELAMSAGRENLHNFLGRNSDSRIHLHRFLVWLKTNADYVLPYGISFYFIIQKQVLCHPPRDLRKSAPGLHEIKRKRERERGKTCQKCDQENARKRVRNETTFPAPAPVPAPLDVERRRQAKAIQTGMSSVDKRDSNNNNMNASFLGVHVM